MIIVFVKVVSGGRLCPCLQVEEEEERRSWAMDAASVLPSPATHAIWTVLKAGETVCQTL